MLKRDADDSPGEVSNESESGDDRSQYEVDFGRGPFQLDLNTTEDAEFLSTNTPGSTFKEFHQLVLMVALKSLDIPYSFYDEGHTNFFGSRGSWMLYDRACVDKREDVAELLRKITVWKLIQWTLDESIVLPEGLTVADIDFEWVAIGMPWWDADGKLEVAILLVVRVTPKPSLPPFYEGKKSTEVSMSLTIFQPDDQDATELIPAGPVLPDFSTIDPMELARFLDHVTRPKHLGGAGWAVTQVAEKCGKSEVWVRDWRRMVMLPEVWQQRLSSGEISQTKALYLLTFNAATIAAFDREFTADPSLFRNRRDFNKRLEAIATHLMPRAVASDKKAVETPLTRRLRNALAKCEAEPDKPSYRLHKHSGQAVVRINSKDHYLGRYGSSESYRLYDELIESYRRGKSVEGVRVTVGELALRYLDYAQKRYTKGGAPTSHAVQIGNALQYAVDEFGKIRAADFSPLKLKAIRDKVAAKCVRTTANKYSRLIVGMFEWAVAEELLPESVYVSLRTMKPLRRGEARANPPVAPVPMEHVTAVKPYVHPSVWGMIQVQLLSAARPGEVRPMRLCDIQTEGGVWVYTPPTHKTDYTGAERPILLGPKAQGVIREFATEDRCAYLFPPPSGYTGSKFYSGDGYANAIRVACKKAGVPRWHPHQLRHNAATLIRQEFDVETAATILGHRDLSTTEIYAERNLKGALTAMEKIG